MQPTHRTRGGLAGAGLGASHDVATLKNDRNGFFLNRGCRGESLRIDCTQEFGSEAERIEFHWNKVLVNPRRTTAVMAAKQPKNRHIREACIRLERRSSAQYTR